MIDKTKLNIYLYKLAKWSGWALVLLFFLYFLSGYGMTKQVIDPTVATNLHNRWLPIPTALAFLLHTLVYAKFTLQRRVKNERWVNAYILILGVTLLLLFLYLYFS